MISHPPRSPSPPHSFVVVLMNDQQTLMDRLCLFAHFQSVSSLSSGTTESESESESELKRRREEEHEKDDILLHCRLFLLLDKDKKVYKGSYLSEYGGPLYSLYPQDGYRYRIPYGEESLYVSFIEQDKKHLYPFLEKDVFETCYHLRVESPSQTCFESFLKDALEYSLRMLVEDHEQNQKVTIFHYTDYWDRFKDISVRSSSTIYLPHQQLDSILEDIRYFLEPSTKEVYHRFGIPYRRNYCFYGPPGTGKTSLIQTIASELKRDICIIRFHPHFTDHHLSKAIQWMPKKSVLVLEDIDSLFSPIPNTSVTNSGLLNFLDGFSGIEGMLTFITTNHIESLNDALLRQGRIHYRLEFQYIHYEQIESMVKTFYPNEMDCVSFLMENVRGLPFTVCHLQSFLFSLYPSGNIRTRWEKWVQTFRKQESSLFASSLPSSILYT